MSNATDASSAPVRGALVVLEGLDRSGKTTQVQLIQNRLATSGRKVHVLRFPDRSSPIGQMIDSYLKSKVEMDDHAIHLLFSANRWEAAKSITCLIESGTTVLCDRYYYSGMVYSSAKKNPSLSLPWARAPEVGLPRPDLVVFLDLEEQQAKQRGGWGDEIYEKAEMQRRVRDLFWGLSFGRIEIKGTSLAGEEQALETGGELRLRQEEEDLYVVDASPSIDEVTKAIWKVVEGRVKAVERGEIGKAVRRVS